MATRQEHAKRMTRIRVKKCERNINKLVNGIFYFEYKKKNGDWNISKLAKDSGTSRNTVYKFLGTKKGS